MIYKKQLKNFIVFLLLLSISGKVENFADEKPTADSKAIKELKKLMETYHQNGFFSGTILVAQEKKIIFEQSYGMADIKNNIKNTQQTIYKIGSLTKMLIAVAFIQLAQEKNISLGTDIEKYIPALKIASAKVKIHHLLTHTAGFADYTKTKGFLANSSKKVNAAELLKLILPIKLEFTPGSQFKYSNSNYLVLGMIIERICGYPLQKFLEKKVFQKAHMSHASLTMQKTAIGYSIGTDREGALVEAPMVHSSRYFAAGGLCATAQDLFKWHCALQDNKLITPANQRRMFMDSVATPYGFKYGSGWIIDSQAGFLRHWHTGSVPGFAARFSFLVDKKIVVILLSNQQNSPIGRPPRSKLADAIELLLLDKPYKMPTIKKAIKINEALVVGLERSYLVQKQKVKLHITREKTRLYVQMEMPNGKRSPQRRIYPQAKDHFFYRVIDASIVFQRNPATNDIESLVIEQGAEKFFAVPIKKTEKHPKNIIYAIKILLENKGNHPSPLPKRQKAAFDTLYMYDKPEAGFGKYLSNGAYNKTYYFRRCNITWYFTQNAKGARNNLFYKQE